MSVMELATLTTSYPRPHLLTDGLSIKVKIVDVRKVWNRIDFLVEPIEGSGQKWVSQDRITNK